MLQRCPILGALLAISIASGNPAWASPEEDSGWFGDAESPENADDDGEAATTESQDQEKPLPPPPEPKSDPSGLHIYTPDEATTSARPVPPPPPESARTVTVQVQAATGDDSTAHAETNPRDPGPPTLLGERITFGGYGGVDVRYSRVSGQDALLVGGEGALLLNHRLAIGGGGYGLSSLVSGPRSPDGHRTFVGLGYGGVIVRNNFVNERLVYLSVGALIGAGGVGFFQQIDENEYDLEPLDRGMDAGAFFVVEPSVGIHLNVTRWMRVGASATYRFTRGIDVEGLDDSDFSGPSAGGHVHFGWF